MAVRLWARSSNGWVPGSACSYCTVLSSRHLCRRSNTVRARLNDRSSCVALMVGCATCCRRSIDRFEARHGAAGLAARGRVGRSPRWTGRTAHCRPARVGFASWPCSSDGAVQSGGSPRQALVLSLPLLNPASPFAVFCHYIEVRVRPPTAYRGVTAKVFAGGRSRSPTSKSTCSVDGWRSTSS